MSSHVVCATCATYYPAGQTPTACPICLDDRQYVPETGQAWTTSEALLREHSIRIRAVRPQLDELEVVPRFSISQRALLVSSPGGNILWDCIPLLTEATVAYIRAKGGLKAIAISHPHYYTNMRQWAETFGCPVYLNQADQQWAQDPGPHLSYWSGEELALWDNMRLLRIGGHFPGSSILHVPALSPQGTILCGDTLYLSPSHQHFAAMHSYPNHIPLPLREMKRMHHRFEQLHFDAIYGFYSYQNMTENARQTVLDSLARYQ